MSTRAQVQVVEGDGTQPWDRVTLYHHTDGYPTNILPGFMEAWDKALQFFVAKRKEWKMLGEFNPHREPRLQRAGHVAALLCHSEPDVYEPEAGHDLHGDLAFYYRLWVTGSSLVTGTPRRGRVRDIKSWPPWQVEVFDGDGKIRLCRKQRIHTAAKNAKSIQRKLYPDD